MTKKIGLLIPILLLGSMYGSIWRDEIKANASNEDTNEREQSMATYSKYSVSLIISSANNAPFCYTYPDTVTANLSKLTVNVIYGTPGNEFPYSFTGYGTGSSTFPSGSTMSTTLTSFDSATNTATVTVYVYIAAFSDDGNTFIGFTQAISYASAVVYKNIISAISVDASSTHKTIFNKGECVTDYTNFAVNITFTSGSYFFDSFSNQRLGSSNYGFSNGIQIESEHNSAGGGFENVGSVSETLTVRNFYDYLARSATTTYSVTVTNICNSISISRQPNDVSYIHGDTIDMTGAIIRRWYQRSAIYGDMYEEDTITSNTQFSSLGYALKWRSDGSSATTAIFGKGDLLVTLTSSTYTGGVTYISDNEVDITVYHELASIAVKTMPTKTTFNVNDTFDTSGLEINATYNDGTTSQVVGFYTVPVSGFKLTNAQLGTLSVTVDYIENGVMVSTSFNVTVLASVQLTSITVKTLPTKAIYKQGEAFASTGLVITANYNNSTTVDLTTGFTLNPNDGYIFTNDDKVAGSKSIVVSLTDYDDEITKTVSFAVSISTIATLTSVQTPVTYVDDYGELDELYVRFITPNTLSNGEPYINFPYLTEAYWNATTGLKVQIDESSYSKSGFEVPWMGYAVQFGNANDIVIGDNLVHRFLPESGTVNAYADKSTVMRYVWIISTIPITEDNAENLLLPVKSDYYDTATSKFISTTNNTCFLTVSNNTLSIAFKTSSLYYNDVYQSSVNNSTQLQGKHIAVFAVQYGKLKNGSITYPVSIASIKKQFLFGLNYIPSLATATLTLTVNGWKLY